MAALRPNQLLERLAKKEPIPAVVLLGADPYLRDLCRNQLIDTFVPESARDWALARLSAADGDWFAISERAQTVPMLSPTQVVVVEDVQALDDLGEEARDEALAALEKYLGDPAPFTVLVLEATALDARKKLFKVLEKLALIVPLDMDSTQAVALAISMAKDLGARLDTGAANLLAESLNFEPARIRLEIEKLALYTHARGKISRDDVEALVVSARRFTVWQLADLLAEGQRDVALAFLDGLLRDGEQPAALVGALAWMFRKLIEARELPAQTNKFQAARQLGMNPDSAGMALERSRKILRVQLLDGLSALAEADSRLKSGVADPRAVMEFLLTRLMSKSAAA